MNPSSSLNNFLNLIKSWRQLAFQPNPTKYQTTHPKNREAQGKGYRVIIVFPYYTGRCILLLRLIVSHIDVEGDGGRGIYKSRAPARTPMAATAEAARPKDEPPAIDAAPEPESLPLVA